MVTMPLEPISHTETQLLNDYSSNSSEKDSVVHLGEEKTSPKRRKRPISEKRAEQNRQAQRLFRQRKEAYLKTLEDRVHALENEKKSLMNVQQQNIVLTRTLQGLGIDASLLLQQQHQQPHLQYFNEPLLLPNQISDTLLLPPPANNLNPTLLFNNNNNNNQNHYERQRVASTPNLSNHQLFNPPFEQPITDGALTTQSRNQILDYLSNVVQPSFTQSTNLFSLDTTLSSPSSALSPTNWSTIDTSLLLPDSQLNHFEDLSTLPPIEPFIEKKTEESGSEDASTPPSSKDESEIKNINQISQNLELFQNLNQIQIPQQKQKQQKPESEQVEQKEKSVVVDEEMVEVLCDLLKKKAVCKEEHQKCEKLPIEKKKEILQSIVDGVIEKAKQIQKIFKNGNTAEDVKKKKSVG